MSGAAPEGKFQDHYVVLGVAPKSSMEDIHQAYQLLVKRYHPSNGTAPDAEKFKDINLAYEVLSDPATRRMFDDLRPDASKDAPPDFDSDGFFETLRTEQNRRMTVLCLLYDRRRFKPVLGSLSQRHLEQMIQATPEQLQLAIFYLQKRGYVEMNDKSSYLITVDGMDYLEKAPPPPEFVKGMLKPLKPVEEQPVAAGEAETAGHPQQLAALQSALAQEAKPTGAAKPADPPKAAPAHAASAKPAPPQIKYRFGNRHGGS